MALQFFNTLTRSIEAFRPADSSKPDVSLYTCGPTVYSYAHIGNFRAYVFEDLLQRHLEYRGYKVRRVMNLTDVDDKTIRGCRLAQQPLEAFTAPFKKAFFEDLDTLRIQRAEAFPAATEAVHIAKMIQMIGILIERGYAYQAEDGSVYFRIARFAKYGQLAHLNLDELRPGGRVKHDEYEKESIGDFALWKAWDEADGDVGWESPWGRGRPGWHIECSAMAIGLLGDEIDIHCGGVDNIFPHHEAEIAQAEACTGKPFVRYWLHCAHLMVEGQKMAKSTGNFYTLRDLLEKGYTGREVRYELMSVNYRLPLNFTFDGLQAARASLNRIDEWTGRLSDLAGATEPEPVSIPEYEAFATALDDDLNISAALGHLFNLLRDSNRAMDEKGLTPGHARALLDGWRKVDSVLGLSPDRQEVPAKVLELVEARLAARTAKDWAGSDRIRDEISDLGWTLKDTREGPKLTPKAG